MANVASTTQLQDMPPEMLNEIYTKLVKKDIEASYNFASIRELPFPHLKEVRKAIDTFIVTVKPETKLITVTFDFTQFKISIEFVHNWLWTDTRSWKTLWILKNGMGHKRDSDFYMFRSWTIEFDDVKYVLPSIYIDNFCKVDEFCRNNYKKFFMTDNPRDWNVNKDQVTKFFEIYPEAVERVVQLVNWLKFYPNDCKISKKIMNARIQSYELVDKANLEPQTRELKQAVLHFNQQNKTIPIHWQDIGQVYHSTDRSFPFEQIVKKRLAPAASRREGGGGIFQVTPERVMLPGSKRKRVVYTNSRGTKHIRIDGKYVLLSRHKKYTVLTK